MNVLLDNYTRVYTCCWYTYTRIFYWAIHTTLYRICCIEYTWLFVNAQCYVVWCISYFKCIFFWHSNILIARNQYNFLKSFKQFTQDCIVYVVLNTLYCLWTLNAMLYGVFSISNVFLFWHSNNLIARNQYNFLKTFKQFTRHCIVYVVLYTLDCLWTLNAMLYGVFRIGNVFFWHLNKFDGSKPTLFLKNIWKHRQIFFIHTIW